MHGVYILARFSVLKLAISSSRESLVHRKVSTLASTSRTWHGGVDLDDSTMVLIVDMTRACMCALSLCSSGSIVIRPGFVGVDLGVPGLWACCLVWRAFLGGGTKGPGLINGVAGLEPDGPRVSADDGEPGVEGVEGRTGEPWDRFLPRRGVSPTSCASCSVKSLR